MHSASIHGQDRVLIVGAAGRDFHNFNLVYRDAADYEVVAFTATQIPNIDGRVYPAELAGRPLPGRHPDPCPRPSSSSSSATHEIDEVVFAYSDVTHEHVMHVGSRALAAGASFRLLAPHETDARVDQAGRRRSAPCARLGQEPDDAATSRDSCARAASASPSLRHPMPYGDLAAQAVQRFERYEDLEAADCTIEEREEYEPHLAEGNLVFAGVDYERDPRRGRAGGRRDPLGRRQQRHAVHQAGPAHRRRRPAPARPRAALPPGRDEPAHGRRLRREQDRQRAAGGHRRRRSARSTSTTRRAQVVLAASPFEVEGDAEQIEGKRVLAIEDGPTLTHGEMTYGAAVLAAKQHGAAELVDPRAVRGRHDRRDVRAVPGHRHAAAGDGLRARADGGSARDDRRAATPTSS